MRKVFAVMIVFMCLVSSAAYSETISLTLDGSKGKLSAEIQKPALKSGEKWRLERKLFLI